MELFRDHLAAAVADILNLAEPSPVVSAPPYAYNPSECAASVEHAAAGNRNESEAVGPLRQVTILSLEWSTVGKALTSALRSLLTNWRVGYEEVEERSGPRLAEVARRIMKQPGQRIIIGRRDRDPGRWQAALSLSLGRGPTGSYRMIGFDLDYLGDALAFLPISPAYYPIYLPGLLRMLGEPIEAQRYEVGEDARVAVAYLGVGWHGLGRRLRSAEILASDTQQYLLDFASAYSRAPRMQRLLGETGLNVARLGLACQDTWLNPKDNTVVAKDCRRKSVHNFADACDLLDEGYWKCYYADAHS